MIHRYQVIVCDPCGAEPPNGRQFNGRAARTVAHRAGFRQDRDGIVRCPPCRAAATDPAEPVDEPAVSVP